MTLALALAVQVRLRGPERGKVIPEILSLGGRAAASRGLVVALTLALDKAVERVCRAAGSDLDVLAHRSGLDAGLSGEVGFCYLLMKNVSAGAHR